jgi:hypothetical protein
MDPVDMERSMTTSQQDNDFLSAVISGYLLEEAIQWISSNMEPEDVFSDGDLRRWALGNEMVDA